MSVLYVMNPHTGFHKSQSLWDVSYHHTGDFWTEDVQNCYVKVTLLWLGSIDTFA